MTALKYSSGGIGGIPTGGPNSPDVESEASTGLELGSRPGPDSSTDASEASSVDAPAGRGPDLISPEGPAIVSDGRSGIEPPVQPGEAPANQEALAATPPEDTGEAPASPESLRAGVTPPVPGRAGDEVEDGALPPSVPSSTDPASEFMARWRAFMDWVIAVDLAVVGPMLSDAEVSELYGDCEGTLPSQVRALDKHRNP